MQPRSKGATDETAKATGAGLAEALCSGGFADDRVALVADLRLDHQDDDWVQVFKVEAASGRLRPRGTPASVPGPVAFAFVARSAADAAVWRPNSFSYLHCDTNRIEARSRPMAKRFCLPTPSRVP